MQSLYQTEFGNDTATNKQAIADFVSEWFGADMLGRNFGPDFDDYLDQYVPDVLKWWYLHGAHRLFAICPQNELLNPDGLRETDDDKMIFYVENQGVYLWAYQIDEEIKADPPSVFGRVNETNEPWIEHEIPFSGFLLLACLFEAVMGKTSHFGFLDVADWKDTQHHLQLRLIPWRWNLPIFNTQFFVGPVSTAMAIPESDGTTQVWLALLNEEAFRSLRHIQWEY